MISMQICYVKLKAKSNFVLLYTLCEADFWLIYLKRYQKLQDIQT